MRTTTIAISLVFGFILSAILLAPLYLALPARYIDNWYYVSPSAALTALLTGIAVASASGFFAAMGGDGSTIRDSTQAGLLSTLIAGTLIVLPASAIESSGALLSLSAYEVTTIDRLNESTIAAVLSNTWLPSAVGLALVLSGSALGAVGGVIYDLWQGASRRPTRLVRRSVVPFVGLVGVALGVALAAIWSGHIEKTVLPKLGYTATLLDRTLLGVPMLTAGAAASWLFSWGVRDVVVTWRDDRRFGALVWLSVLSVTALLSPVLAAVLHAALFFAPTPYLSVAMVLLAGFVSLITAARSDIVKEPHPRVFGEVFGEILFAALLFVALLVFIGGSQIASSYILTFPYVRALLAHSLFVDAPPVAVVTSLFRWHWAICIVAFGTAFLFEAVALPLWSIRRTLRR